MIERQTKVLGICSRKHLLNSTILKTIELQMLKENHYYFPVYIHVQSFNQLNDFSFFYQNLKKLDLDLNN